MASSAPAPPATAAPRADPLAPVPYRVRSRASETADTATLVLEPMGGRSVPPFLPGQFNMLYAFGLGEVAISISGDPGVRRDLTHTIRCVGKISTALSRAGAGDVVGVRGPYGHGWPLDTAEKKDLIVLAGGLGLAPLRPVLYEILAHRERFGRIEIIYGARTPRDLLYYPEIQAWRMRPDWRFQVTVDTAGREWYGDVGVVTTRLPDTRFDPAQTVAFVCGPEIMMRVSVRALEDKGVAAGSIYLSMERNMKCAVAFCGHCQLGPSFVCRDGPVLPYRDLRPWMAVKEISVTDRPKPRLAVFKFASCDGCQLTLLDCEDELLPVAERLDIANFMEASKATSDGPYDLTLVEGSITTESDARRIREIRAQSKFLVTIGACATAGGVQALRNFADVDEFRRAVYARPEYISTLATSTAVAEHVPVDFELRGCPISKEQLLEVITAFLGGRLPDVPTESVCVECKRRGTVCVMVAHGTPCLGPVTQTGCGAICPTFHRGCYGCFGPQDAPNTESLTQQLRVVGMPHDAIRRVYRTFNANAPAFRRASEAVPKEAPTP